MTLECLLIDLALFIILYKGYVGIRDSISVVNVDLEWSTELLGIIPLSFSHMYKHNYTCLKKLDQQVVYLLGGCS